MRHVSRLVPLLLAALALAVACTDDDPSVGPTAPSVTATSVASVTASPTAAPTQSATPTQPPPPAEARSVTGLFAAAEPTEITEVRDLPAPPSSPFEPWNGRDVVVYDTVAGTELNLGPGFVGFGPSFSPDGTRFAWTEGPPDDLSGIWVLNLASGDRRRIADGVALRWLDDDTLYARQRMESNLNERLDVQSGEWSDSRGVDPNQVAAPQRTDRWLLDEPSVATLPSAAYPYWNQTFTLTDITGALAPLVFEAYAAELAPDGTLFIATTPTDAVLPPDSGPHIEYGTTNIFEVDPLTGAATFVASAEASAPNWAFDASEHYVGWMDGYCAQDFSDIRTVLLDRETGEITAVDRGMWFSLTSGDLIASGSFGARQLIDPETLETVAMLPAVGDVAWSHDYHYAAVGFQFGHGGLCG